ncbi:MAG TPA: protein kinase [Thermoanaerobaculia bacterium]
MSESEETHPDPGPWPPLAGFRPGDQIAGRYRVLRWLGRGAMGEVLAVRDEELGSEVALKLLKLEAHADAGARERFKREILLARRVSHPNVCRIYDFGTHVVAGLAGVASGPLHFLTMELLAGETLVERLEREGPMSVAAALAIARQLAAALDAAHAAGVVHRDFKSSNVMLVGGAVSRAVVTDFGLARDAVSRADGGSLTATGGVLGTPAYMSPEQVEGAAADARSDLYALGVVLFEMLTGRFPFEGDSPLSVAVKRLREPPAPPELFRPDLSPAVRATLKRALARRPEARYASAGALVRDLAGEAPPAAPRRRGALAAALAGIALVGAAGWWALRERAVEPAPAAARAARLARPALAVLPLKNSTGHAESAWLGTALAEMLTSELAAGEAVRAVPGETVGRAVRDLELAAGEALSAGTLARLRRGLGADVVLTGSYVALGEPGRGPLRLDLRLQFLDGRPDLPRLAEGTEADLFALVTRTGAELRAALGLPVAASSPRAAAGAQLHGERALRLYALGLEALRAGDPQTARAQLEEALAEAPDSPLAWSALSEAWSLLGWGERAREAAERAFELRGALPRAEALAVEGRFRLASSDWDAAIEIQRALWRLYGDDPEQGLRLVHALLEADRGRDADAVLAELRALPAPAGEDPRIDLYEARAADGLSEPRRQLDAALRAETKAAEAGARSLVGRALYEQGLARRKLGEPEPARAALARSRQLARELGDRSAEAVATLSLANQVRAEGRLAEAAALYGEARATFAALGNRQREARTELLQGLVVSQQGEIADALALYEGALAKLRELGDRRGSAAALANIGTLLYERGDLAGAERRHDEALAEFRSIGDDSRAAVALQNLAQVRFDRGDLAGARRDLDEELAIARRSEDKTVEGYALKALGDLESEGGRFDAAEGRYREAIAAFDAAGQGTWKLYAEMALAVLDRERGRPGESAAALARVAAELGRDGLTEDRDEAELQRVRALVAVGQTADATAVARGVLPRAAASETARLRHLALWADAELALASGDRAAAEARLDELTARARRAGLVLVELEAAAARTRITGDAAAAAAVRGECERLGAGRIARRLVGR